MLTVLNQVYASELYLLVVGDSCGYEVAKTIIEEYSYLARVLPYMLFTEIPDDVVLVVLFTNVTPREAFDQVLGVIVNVNLSIITTDIFLEYASTRTSIGL